MSRGERPHPRRQRQQADQESSNIRNTSSRTSSTRIRRPPNRHLELRRSARIAQLLQQRSTQLLSEPQQEQSSTMADVARRTYARNDHGPRAVDSRRSTRTDMPTSTNTRNTRAPETSSYTLNIVTGPSSSLSPNIPFTTTILISTRSSNRPSSPSGLLAVASLVAETSQGPRPLPAGYLITASPHAKLMDSVQPASTSELRHLPRERRAEVVGAVKFDDLCIRERGVFRLRVTLAKMQGDVYEAVAEVDSAAFSVGGRGTPNGVKH